MELTLEQALQKGIEAHKAGKAQEADRYYTAILKANPKHPDANHNMAVLAVGVGKVQESLPFFKTALEANAGIAQYWLSYIDALIKLDRLDDAKTVFDQAKSNGAKGDPFDQLEKKLGVSTSQNSDTQEPSQAQMKPLIALYSQGQFEQALDEALKLLVEFPNSVTLYNITGASNKALGKLDEAVDAFKKAISINPEFAVAHNNLGTAFKDQNKLDEAIEAFNKAISINPEYAEAFNNMGLVIKDQGRLNKAIYALKKATAFKPDYAEAYSNLGIALSKKGRLDKAINAYEKAIKIKPDYAEAHYNKGMALHAGCKLEGALAAYKKAIEIRPDYADAYNNLGIALAAKHELDEAIAAYKKAIQIKPDYAEAYHNAGVALQTQDKLTGAIEAYKKAIEIKPDYAEAHHNLSITFQTQGQLSEAIEACQRAIEVRPSYADAYNNLGISLSKIGKIGEAMNAFNEAISLKENYAEAQNNIANSLRDHGELERAIEAYNKVIEIDPEYAEAHRHLSLIQKYSSGDPKITFIKDLLKKKGITDDAKCHLNFTLAKMFGDLGEHKKAYKYLSEGNNLRKKLLNYSTDKDMALFGKLKNIQPNLLKASLDTSKIFNKLTPIFIVGMPRSGTTLIEQIISSHSEVTGAGELKYISIYGGALATGAEAVTSLSISEFRDKYLLELVKQSNDKQYITDKMPQNFLTIPLICAAFPEAKIIHVKRDPRAVCWSNFKHYFAGSSLGYCYNLEDVVSYYRLYSDLMKLWQSKYNSRIYNLDYEKLTTDQKNETKKLIKYLGLNWEKACLSPHNNKRSVRTASQQQVKQKIYQGSSEAWREYEPYLNGAFDSLLSI